MDIFSKCSSFTLARECRERGVYPYFHALESRQDTVVTMEGARRIMLGSNNYLGLTIDPEVVSAAVEALGRLGTGCSGSRFLNGTLGLHLELERELAAFLRREGCVTFSTGFQANLGIISALVGRGDYVICDRENHASIYDGCRLSQGKMLRFRQHGQRSAAPRQSLREILLPVEPKPRKRFPFAGERDLPERGIVSADRDHDVSLLCTFLPSL